MSIKLIRLFKLMKDCIVDNPALSVNQQLLSISAQTTENTMAIKRIEDNMVSHDDLTDFIKLFDQGIQSEEYLILDGKPFAADAAYQKIYRTAKKSIIVIDDYIDVKTLQHLAIVNDSIEITVISDNKGNRLRKIEYDDFQKEYPSKTIRFIKSNNRSHDRYIIDAAAPDHIHRPGPVASAASRDGKGAGPRDRICAGFCGRICAGRS